MVMQRWSCGRPKPEQCESCCEQHATGACEFELLGKRAGERCGRRFCDEHRKVVDGKRYCLPHVNFAAQRRAD